MYIIFKVDLRIGPQCSKSCSLSLTLGKNKDTARYILSPSFARPQVFDRWLNCLDIILDIVYAWSDALWILGIARWPGAGEFAYVRFHFLQCGENIGDNILRFHS